MAGATTFMTLSHALLKLAARRYREVQWIVYLFAAFFVLRYAFLIRG